MSLNIDSKQVFTKRISFWKALLILILLIGVLVLLFPSSEFLGFFILFSPLILFLLFSVKSVNAPSKKLSWLKKGFSLLGILAIQLFFVFIEFIAFINIGVKGPLNPTVYLNLSLIIPVVIWITYYLIKKEISSILIIVTGIPAVLALLINQIFRH